MGQQLKIFIVLNANIKQPNGLKQGHYFSLTNSIICRVTVGEFVATGCGQSKKKAKHSAAKVDIF